MYAGVDLSTSKHGTGVCRLTWDGGMDLDRETGLSLDDVLDKPFAAAAVDVPFGWPVDFVLAVSEWSGRRDADAKPSSSLIADGYLLAGERLRFRTTDRFVRKAARHLPDAPSGGWPQGLSVTKDMITGTALHGMYVLGSRYPPLVFGQAHANTPGHVVEAYPAAALIAWNIDAGSYKGKDGRSARGRILSSLEREASSLAGVIEDHRDALLESDDLLDAFICALVARAWHLGHTWLPHHPEVLAAMCFVPEWSEDERTFKDEARFLSEISQEGWIALPAVPLGEALG